MAKISVIIPVYNVEKYLRECLDSVVNQTYKDIEIICINDGSIDNSLKILEEYSQNDNRIKIFNQTNQGVSVARNIGTKESSGEYIMFVDSDDWIEKDCVELVYNKIKEKNSDICCFGINEIRDGKINIREWEKEYLEKFKNRELDVDALKRFCINACGKLIKLEFLKKNNILFPTGIKIGEDSIFNLICYFYNPKYSILNKQLYNYDIERQKNSHNAVDALFEDLKGYKSFLNSEIFINSSDEYKKFVLEKFIGQMEYYYNKNYYTLLISSILILKFKNYLYSILNHSILYETPKFEFINKFNIKNLFIESIFSLKNVKTNYQKIKILTIFGINIPIKKEDINV